MPLLAVLALPFVVRLNELGDLAGDISTLEHLVSPEIASSYCTRHLPCHAIVCCWFTVV